MTDDATGAAGPGGSPAATPLPESFANFRRDHWYVWIRKFLNGELCEPGVAVGGQQPSTALASLYESLGDVQRDQFAAAVGDVFSYTQPSARDAKFFRPLIELLSLLTPYEARDTARRRLYLRSFERMKDDGADLHTLLLVANCKYPIDAELTDFIETSAAESGDFGYIVTCMRAVSETGGGQYLRFLEIALPLVNTRRRAAVLAREVGDILYLHRARHFCKWYGVTARTFETAWALQREAPLFDSFELFEGMLKQLVFTDLDVLGRVPADPHRALVAAQLHAYDRRFTSDEVLALARLHQSAGKANTINALINIGRRSRRFLLHGGLPWYYTALPRRRSGNGGPPFPAHISSGPNFEMGSAEFYETQEPELAEIFETVKDDFYDVPEAPPIAASAGAGGG